MPPPPPPHIQAHNHNKFIFNMVLSFDPVLSQHHHSKIFKL